MRHVVYQLSYNQEHSYLIRRNDQNLLGNIQRLLFCQNGQQYILHAFG